MRANADPRLRHLRRLLLPGAGRCRWGEEEGAEKSEENRCLLLPGAGRCLWGEECRVRRYGGQKGLKDGSTPAPCCKAEACRRLEGCGAMHKGNTSIFHIQVEAACPPARSRVQVTSMWPSSSYAQLELFVGFFVGYYDSGAYVDSIQR